jgi:TonB-dependent receptor-like protein
VRSGQIFDPFSLKRLADGTLIRDTFINNQIPASQINQVSKRLIDLVPPPNSSGSPNFVRNLSDPLNVDIFVGKVDWVRSDKNFVSSHFVYSDQHSFTEPILGLPADGGNATNFRTSNQRQFGLGWTHVLGPRDLNEFRIGYVRNTVLQETVQSNEDLNAKYGIPFSFAGPNAGGMASLGISGFTNIGTSIFGPFFQFINKYEISDSYTMTRGAHSFKFGGRSSLKTFQNQKTAVRGRGELLFNGVFTRQPGFNNTGSAVADFLTGVANSAGLANVLKEKDVGRDIDAYAQDRWRASSKLTITLGVRYQYNPPSWEARDQISSVVFDRGFTNPQVVVPKGQDNGLFTFMRDTLLPFITVRRANELDRGLVHNTYKNFAPRLGIAYQLGPKTVLRTGYGIFFGFPDVVSGSVLTTNPPLRLFITQASNTVDPTLLIDTSVFGPLPFNRALTNPAFRSIRATDFPPEFTQMYNLSVQHEFAPNWLAEIGFLGNRSSRVAVVASINDAFPALPSDTSSVQSRRRISKVLSDLPYFAPQGFSNYNALTLNLEKRFSEGLSLLANYTWARALGVAPAITLGINDVPIQNPFDLKREYGPLEFDVINRVSISYIYDLPFGKGKSYLSSASRVLNHLVAGWQINGITTFQGGFPITPVLGFSLGKTDTPSRPNAIGDPTKTSRQPNDWISAAAFAVPSDAQVAAGNFYGNAGRGSMRAPGLTNFDFSILKNFTLREDVRLQFRTELFNITNTPFFGIPGGVGTNFNSPTFGKVTVAGDPRVIQFGLKLIF